MRLLAISGSLRAVSSNTALLEAAALAAPPGIEVTLYRGLADLPHFNPDLDGEGVAPPVTEFRLRLRESEGVVLSVPEYAHGVPGSFKNALDWVVGSGELYGKPVAVFQATGRSSYALASLLETLRAQGADLFGEASVTLELMGKRLGAAEIAANAEMAGALRNALAEFKATLLRRSGAG
jgi:NAD(P)H-dependent FMN reductase